MSRVLIDANIFIYLHDNQSPHYQPALDILESLTLNNHQGFFTPYILNEIHYHYLKHYNHETAISRTNNILAMPNLECIDLALTAGDLKKIFSLACKYHLKTFDAFHAYYCKKLKIKSIATFDPDFKSVPWLKIYSPTVLPE